MPSFDKSILLNLTNQTNLTNTANPAATAIQCGTDIPDDKVRRIWRFIVINTTGGALTIYIYAGDNADPDRRLIYQLQIAANATEDQPDEPDVQAPIFLIRPQTQFSPTQENQVRAENNGAANTDIQWFYHYYDLRG